MEINELNTPNPQIMDELLTLWLETNQQAHAFIPSEYWRKKAPEVRELLPSARLFVASEAGQIKGFLGLMDHYIAGLFIKANAQGQGLGSQLLALVQAQQTVLELDVYQQNQAARAFYQKHGFVPVTTSFDETGQTYYRLRWQKLT